MNTKPLLFSICLIVGCIYQHPVQAQCCGAGNPISVSNADNNVKKKHLQFTVDYRHSMADTYYEGSHSSDFDFPGKIRKAKYDFMNLGVGYGITKRLTLQAQLGYYIQKSEDYKLAIFPDAKASGIGDLSLTASYAAYQNLQKGIEVVPFLMVKFPVGKFDCENAGVKLPISMQPSSGSYKYAGGVYFYANLSKHWYITSYNLYEYAQRIQSTNFDYQYGGLLYLNAASYYKANKSFSVGLQLGYEYMGRAKSDKEILVGTSYQNLKLTPQILYKLNRQIQLIYMVDIPVWRKVEEIQMSNKWAIQVRLIYNLSLM